MLNTCIMSVLIVASTGELLWSVIGMNLNREIIGNGKNGTGGTSSKKGKRAIRTGDTVKECLVVKPYDALFLIGVFRVEFNALETSSSQACFFRTKKNNPYAVITGGNSRVHGTESDLIFTAEDSFDITIPPKHKAYKMDYQWQYKKDISKTQTRMIPKGDLFDGLKLEMKLQVQMKIMSISPSEWVQQTVEIKTGAPSIVMRCRKNCQPESVRSYTNEQTILFVTCNASCDSVEIDNYQWRVTRLSKKTVVHSKSGIKTLIIEENFFESETYEFEVTNQLGKSVMKLSFIKRPKIKCSITPEEGFSLDTLFKIKCDSQASVKEAFIEVRGTSSFLSDDELVISGSAKELYNRPGGSAVPFQLDSEKSPFKIRIHLPNVVVTDVDLPVKFKKVSSPVTDFAEDVDKTFGNLSLAEMLKSNDPEVKKQGLKLFDNVVGKVVMANLDLGDREVQTYIEQLKLKAVQAFSEAPAESVEEISEMADSLNKLMFTNELNASDPLLAKFTSAFCLRMATEGVNILQQQVEPQAFAAKARKAANSLSKCTEANSRPAPDLLDIADVTIGEGGLNNNSVGGDISAITENYPDYQYTDDKYLEHMKNLKDTSDNVIKTSSLNAKILALTTYEGEGTKTINQNKSSTILEKDFGMVLYRKKIGIGGVRIIPSHDWSRDEHYYDIFLTVFNENVFWWNQATIVPATRIANMEFWHSTCKDRVSKFKEPVSVFFKVLRRPFLQIFEGVVSITGPEFSDEELKLENYFHRSMRVFRASVAANQSFMVHFHNLTDSDIFDVVLTQFEFPTSAHLATKKKFVVKLDEHTTISVKNKNNFDVWYYMGILPNREMISKNVTRDNFTFRFSFVSGSCIRWDNSTAKWKIACLHSFYFLTDNLKRHRYAYLLEIRTHSSRGSGTTSNIVVKINGSEDSSLPHVLNYPDPGMRILQRGKLDFFVLTTLNPLGELQSVELWFDSLGAKTEWYCKYVKVYDMQLLEDSLFNVNAKFSVVKGKSYVMTNKISAEELEQSKKCRNRVKEVQLCCDKYHTWRLDRFEVCFSYVKRLSVLFSNFMFTGVLSLAVLGMPKLERADCLDALDHYTFNKSGIFATFVSSSCSFLVHIALAWGFRFSQIHKDPQNVVGLVPFKFTVLLWFVLVALLLCNTSILIALGFWMTFYTSMMWLTSCLVGIGLQIIFYETLALIIFTSAFVIKLKSEIFTIFREILAAIEVQRKFLYALFGDYLLRPYFSKLYTPLKSVDIKKYVNKTFLNVIQPPTWYGNYSIAEPALMKDMNNKFLGVARLRQHRVQQDYCSVAKEMRFLNMSCEPEISLGDEEFQSFGIKWSKNTSSSELLFDRLRDIWSYESDKKSGALAVQGEIGHYSGGGYVLPLGRTLKNSYVNVLSAFNRLWINDDYTRCVFLEVLLYNVNSNIFNSVEMLYEQSATGYVHCEIKVWPERIIFFKDENESIIVFFAFFIAWVCILLVKKSMGVIKNLRSFYKDFWLLCDFFILLMSITSIVMTLVRTVLVERYVKQLEKVKHNEFVPYFSLFYFESIRNILGASLICVATIRLWKFVRFGIIFRVMETTLILASEPLLSVTLVFVVFLIAFAFSAMLIVGNQFKLFSGYVSTFRTLISFQLQAQTRHATTTSTMLHLSVFELVSEVIFVLYITVIVMAYSRARLALSQDDEYTIKHYFFELVDYVFTLLRFKKKYLVGGADSTSPTTVPPVHAKADDFFFAHSVNIEKKKVKMMAVVTSSVLRRANKFRRDGLSDGTLKVCDELLMVEVCRSVFFSKQSSDDMEVFFKGHSAGQKLRTVHESRVNTIKDAACLLFPSQLVHQENRVEKLTESRRILEKASKIMKKNNIRLHISALQLRLINASLNELSPSVME